MRPASNRLFAVALPAVVILAAALRLNDLSSRPMHGDEAVHAYKLNTLWTTGRYEYDPFEYHGPTLYYFTLPLLWIAGVHDAADMTEALLRMTPALFGVATVALCWLLLDGFGRRAALFGALFVALSPAMAYYSRYYVQETLMTFFCAALLACAWRYRVNGKLRWAIAAGAMLGFAHASKETCVIAFAALGLAFFVVRLLERRTNSRASVAPLANLKGADSANPSTRRAGAGFWLGAATAIAVSVICFSTFFTHARGPLDSILTYKVYLDRAGGNGIHDHPWWYYLWLLGYARYAPGPAWSEGAILLLAAVGACATIARRAAGQAWQLPAILTIYGAAQLIAYSAIPYKTPWCVLGFLHAFALLAGVGLDALLTWCSRRIVLRGGVAALAVAAFGHLAYQALRADSPRFSSSNYNPYAYAHPVLGVVRLGEWAERLAAVDPARRGLFIRVISDNSWPLPWYLRGFERVGYWETPPEDCDAAMVICDARAEADVALRMRGEYQVSYYGLRPDVVLAVFVERGLYERFVASQSARSTAP